MLQGLEDLAVLADKNVAVVTLNQKEYSVRLLAYIRRHNLEIKSDVPAEVLQECYAEFFGRFLERGLIGDCLHGRFLPAVPLCASQSHGDADLLCAQEAENTLCVYLLDLYIEVPFIDIQFLGGLLDSLLVCLSFELERFHVFISPYRATFIFLLM
ncbi:MAG: hypothetical protein A4E61_00025 [Syntrophorhabdus sp. PtaB.Bin184]|nr:MAG: hypothetical protein A4E61_00025 [Syntrophorhabdus sp. PtaB.Bin184]